MGFVPAGASLAGTVPLFRAAKGRRLAGLGL